MACWSPRLAWPSADATGYTDVRVYVPGGNGLAASDFSEGATSPDFRDGVINLNLILRWDYRPGSVLMLLYVHQHNQIGFNSIIESVMGLRFDRFGGEHYIDMIQAKATYLF